MPTLAQSTAASAESLGYSPVSIPVTRPNGAPSPPPNAPYLRSATPSTGVSPDTLRLFEQSGQGLRQQRVIAVPQLADAQAEGTVDITNVTSVNSSGSSASSGGGTSGSTTAAAAANTAVTTPSLNQNGTFLASVTLGKTFVLQRLAVSSPARVQFYSSAAAQQGDAGRPVATPIVAGASTGLIADFNLALASEATFVCSPAVLGFNAESPRSGNIYITVTNLQATSQPITVSLLYLPLET